MANIKIAATIAVKPEHRAELAAVFSELVAASRAEAGNLRYDLHQDIADENRFVFFENWRDQAAVDSHNASEHFTALVPRMVELSDSAPVITQYEEV